MTNGGTFVSHAAVAAMKALSPARVVSVDMDEASHRATVTVTDDQQSLAIGRGGQNVRLAAKLTGWSIDIKGSRGEEVAQAERSSDVEESAPAEK